MHVSFFADADTFSRFRCIVVGVSALRAFSHCAPAAFPPPSRFLIRRSANFTIANGRRSGKKTNFRNRASGEPLGDAPPAGRGLVRGWV